MVIKPYKIFILDIPRAVKMEEVPYRALEKIKDGVIISSKYEGRRIYFPHPHLICFANCKPK